MKARRKLEAFAVAVASVLVQASPARADVRVERAPNATTCPDPESFAARASEGVSEERKRALRITVRFERTATGFASAVRTTDGAERVLDDSSPVCDGLADATLLAVRLAFDRDESSAPPAPAPAPAPTTDADEERVPVPVEREEPRGKSGPRLSLLAGAASSFGLRSSFTPGARVLGGVRWGARAAWWAGATGFYFPPQTERFGTGTVDLEMLGGGLDACRRATFDSFGGTIFGLCGRAEAARLLGTAHGFVKNQEAARPLLSVSLLLRAHHRIAGPFEGFAELGGVVPINRERFEIQGVGRVYDPPAVAATGTIGVGVDFE